MKMIYTNFCQNLQEALGNEKIQLRPQCRSGLWVIVLLPLAIIVSSIRYPQTYFVNYRICSIICMGMVITTLMHVYDIIKKGHTNLCKCSYLSVCVLLSAFMHFVLKLGLLFSLFSSLLSTIFYVNVHVFLMKTVQKSFTFGEASLISQSITLLIYTSATNLIKFVGEPPIKNFDISVVIIQIGLIGIATMCFLTYVIPLLRRPFVFYPYFVFSILTFVLLPLHVILKRSPLFWILEFLTEDMAIIVHWILCCMMTGFAIDKQIDSKTKASTVARKMFHFLAIGVYLPGLLYKCTTLYLASGVALGLFMTIELVRKIELPPISDFLENGFSVYYDEKDAGGLALTPIYLLIGFSLPLWIHPVPCDVTDSAVFNLVPLLSGLCTIGFGDTGASYFGTRFGRHRWPGTKKTVEGTIGCILSQLLFLLVCYISGIIDFRHGVVYKLVISVLITSLVEAFTTQVDNLVLPLISYMITV